LGPAGGIEVSSERWKLLIFAVHVINTLVLVGQSLPVAKAAEYPVKPIKLVVGGPAGGSTDVVARQVAELLAARLKQPVLIENRPGAGGAIGARLVAKAAPDGYTLFMCNSGTHGGNTVMYQDLGYDPVKDFAPIVRIASVPFILIVGPSSTAQSVKNLVDIAKAQPGKLKFGFAGKGGFNHIVGELFQHHADVQFVPVGYKGLNEVVTDIAGAHIDLAFPTPGESLGLINAGRVRALAVTGPRRLAALPNVPTIGEAGYPSVQLLGWGGLCAPAATPSSVIRMLNEQTLAALTSAPVKADFERRGYEIVSNSADDFAGFIKSEIARIGETVDQLGVRPDQ
jgi:tripartite-type tricarboxylate transporter receptor subunit TctC